MEQKVFRSSQRRKVLVNFLKVSVIIFFSKMDMEIRMVMHNTMEAQSLLL